MYDRTEFIKVPQWLAMVRNAADGMEFGQAVNGPAVAVCASPLSMITSYVGSNIPGCIFKQNENMNKIKKN
jgi:hypothetical protein